MSKKSVFTALLLLPLWLVPQSVTAHNNESAEHQQIETGKNEVRQKWSINVGVGAQIIAREKSKSTDVDKDFSYDYDTVTKFGNYSLMKKQTFFLPTLEHSCKSKLHFIETCPYRYRLKNHKDFNQMNLHATILFNGSNLFLVKDKKEF